MPQRELRFDINEVDAYQAYGAYLTEGALAALMTPPPMKEYVTNDARQENGIRISNRYPRVTKRDLTLPIAMSASTSTEFLTRYKALCEALAGGLVRIRTRFDPSVEYKCYYQSCSQYQQWDGTLAKIMLKLIEPDPTDRSPMHTIS